MEKRKNTPSKITGRGMPAGDEPELNVIVYVRSRNYVPNWLTVRKKITDSIFTATVNKAQMARLEADEQVISVSINEQLDNI